MTAYVIIACHNRREKTLRAINTMLAAADAAATPVKFIVFDDGSTDATGATLARLQADVQIIAGSGTAYWAKGMSLAEHAALDRAQAGDWVVWLNDDVEVRDHALVALLQNTSTHEEAVYVGAMQNHEGGTNTYGGLVRSGLHPLRFARLDPWDTTRRIDTFNGNLVFVPFAVAILLGGIDGGYPHAWADIEYGLRCKKRGIPVYLLPSALGYCPRDDSGSAGGLMTSWQQFVSVKGGGNYPSLKRILRQTSPHTWLAYVTITYALWWLRNCHNAGVEFSKRVRCSVAAPKT